MTHARVWSRLYLSTIKHPNIFWPIFSTARTLYGGITSKYAPCCILHFIYENFVGRQHDKSLEGIGYVPCKFHYKKFLRQGYTPRYETGVKRNTAPKRFRRIRFPSEYKKIIALIDPKTFFQKTRENPEEMLLASYFEKFVIVDDPVKAFADYLRLLKRTTSG